MQYLSDFLPSSKLEYANEIGMNWYKSKTSVCKLLSVYVVVDSKILVFIRGKMIRKYQSSGSLLCPQESIKYDVAMDGSFCTQHFPSYR